MLAARVVHSSLLLSLCSAAKPVACKWAQHLNGQLDAVFQIKRAGGLCEGERATVEAQTLLFSMVCAGEEYALSVPLQHPVDESRVSLRRERAQAVVTMHKKSLGVWWSSLAKQPEKFKKLIERDQGRGDPEPDPEDLEDAAAEAASTGDAAAFADADLASARVDADGRATSVTEGFSSSTATSRRAKAAAEAAEAEQQAAHQEWEQAHGEATKELQDGGKVTPQTVAKLKALLHVLQSEEGLIARMLGLLYLKRGDKSDGETMLRRAIKLCKTNEDWCKGVHQTLAQSLTNSPSGRHGEASPAAAKEALKLYQKGTALMPDDYETYYQIGRLLNTPPEQRGGKKGGKDPIGGKSDKASAALRIAASLKPDNPEALQMLSMRLVKSPRKKTRQAAKKIANKAVRIDPSYAMSYVALGYTLMGQETDETKMSDGARGKVVGHLRTALGLSEKYEADGKGAVNVPLSRERKAECHFIIGRMLSVNDAKTGMAEFQMAVQLNPREARYREAVSQLQSGANEYRKKQQADAMAAEKERLKRLEEEEDAAWEEDEAGGGFSSIGTHD